MKIHNFKTLQSRLILFLLLPVFLILLSAGIFSFLYARNTIFDQWNEAAILKLQRAAHQIEMRLAKSIELMKMFYETGSVADGHIPQRWIIERLESLEGVVRVDIKWFGPNERSYSKSNHAMHMGSHEMMRFHHGEFSKITEPQFDADAGHETVTLISSLLSYSDKVVGKLEIALSFDYLIKDVIAMGWWQSGMACIVDRSGEFIIHTSALMKGRQMLGETNDTLEMMVHEEMKNRPYGTVRALGNPPVQVAGFYSLQHAPWAIVVFAPGKKILRPIIHFRNTFAFGSLILVLIVILLIRSHVSKIVRKIKQLSKNAEKVAKGEYGRPIKVKTRDEIGQLVRSYNSMVEGLRERDFIQNTFGRYIDPDFAKALLKRPETTKLGGQKREVVIMMSDIRGFTSMAETLSPEATIHILNDYFSHMIKIIQKYRGIIVDFVGDAILVFFDPMNGSLKSTVINSIQCAFIMQNEMHMFNQKMKKEGLPEFDIGIGINAGHVVVGNIGSEARAKYGIVGSAVNLIQRIQEKAKSKEVVISDTVYNQVTEDVVLKKSFQAYLKGLNTPMSLYVIAQ